MSSEPEAQPGESAAVFAPGPGRLLLHGLSSNQVWVIAGVFFYVGGNLLDRFGKRLQTAADRLLENGLVADFPESAWLLGLVVLVGFLLLLFGLSALLALMRYWRFILLEREGRLIAAGGLFDRREQTLRRTKVTGLVLRQSAVGRLLGCWSVIVRQTRSSEQEPGAGRNAFLVPALRTADRRLTENLLSGAVFPARFVGISPLFRRFAWSRLLLALILTVILLASVLGIDHWSLLAVALAAAIYLPAVQLRFRHWGWALEGRLLWVRRGLLGQRIDGFALDQVQQARVTSSPYLRRHDLVGLELVLPQGTIGLPFLTAPAAAELANRALAAAEQAPTHQV